MIIAPLFDKSYTDRYNYTQTHSRRKISFGFSPIITILRLFAVVERERKRVAERERERLSVSFTFADFDSITKTRTIFEIHELML